MTATRVAPAPPRTRIAPDWTLTHALRARAVDRGDHPAIVCEGRSVSYATMAVRSTRIAHALLRDGVHPGDRVAYLARESEHYYAAILACAAIGAVLVPVNWRLTAPEVEHILRDSGAVLVFVELEFAAAITIPDVEIVALDTADAPQGDDHGAGLSAWIGEPVDEPLPLRADPDDAVVQIYTSGTTGLPKGVMLAHRSFFTLPAASAEAGVRWIDWRADDVNLIALPGLGIAGIGWFMHGFVAGGTNVLMRVFESQQAITLIMRHGVTTTFVAPAMLQMMLNERSACPAAFETLRKIAYGAAPMPEDLLLRCLDIMGCEFVQIYSSTEAGSVAVCLPPSRHVPGDPALASVGHACPGNVLQVVDEHGGALPPGEIGHVRIRTPARMLGYWRRPQDTARTIRDGWLYMGDAGYLDADGLLHLCDRLADTVIVAGQNVYPAEVERELVRHPAVAEAAVVGLPDPDLGDAVHACLVASDGVERPTLLELSGFLRQRLAGFKIPTGLSWVDELPRNPAGKVLRRVARQSVQDTRTGPGR